MTSNTDLAIIDQKDILFYEDTLTAVRSENGTIYVSIRQMCDALGIDRRGQIRRIQGNEVLFDGYARGGVTSPPSASGRGGGTQQVGLLDVELVPLWLAGISTKRVNDDIRPKLIRFQKEAGRILREAFQNGELSFDDNFSELLAQGGDAVEAYQMLQGMLKLAKNQILLQSSVKDNSNRISALESQLSSPNRLITSEQSMHVSQAVKTIALEMGKRSGRNEFQGVYGELYRRFKIPSYRELPATQYDEAMNFLRDWYSSVIGGDIPF